ncbi:hypothetical protein R6Q59_029730 [Mikania micrantha]
MDDYIANSDTTNENHKSKIMAFGKKVSSSRDTQPTEDHHFGSDDDVEEIPNPQTEEPVMESTQEEVVTEIQSRLLTALVCEYLDWAQFNHTQKVYLPECNLQKDAWKTELKNLSNKNGYDMNRNGDSGPLLLDVLEGYLKVESQSQVRSGGRRLVTPDQDTLTNFDSRNRRSSSSSVIGGLPPLGRQVPSSQVSDRRGGSSNSGYKKDDYNRRYDNDDIADDIMLRASAALENLQLDRKTRNLTSSWRHGGDGSS